MAKTSQDIMHVAPNFTVEYDAKAAEAAQKKLEGLRDKEADLVQQLRDLRKEISLTASEARKINQPGFSNADGKTQRDKTKRLESSFDEVIKTPAPATSKK